MSLLPKFEVYYKEFKDYENFYNDYEKKQMDTMKDRVKSIVANPEDTKNTVEFIVSNSIVPKIYAQDLNKLKEKLLVAYNMFKDEKDFPQELKQELDNLSTKQEKPITILKKGEIEIVNKPYYDMLVQSANHPQTINNIVESFKRVKDLDKL